MGLPFGAYSLLTKTKIVSNLKLDSEINSNVSCLMFGRAKMSLTRVQQEFAISEYRTPKEVLTGWAEPFLKFLGCETVDSLDFSDFETAKVLWNLNKSLNREDPNKPTLSSYDLILDYGTSEHVINPAMSVYNATKLLKVGGVLNTMLPVVGWVDHGFFQFSPCFFYAINCPELELENLYFWIHDRSTSNLHLWDGLSHEIEEHVHNAFDGSFAANCFEFLNKRVMAWATFKKNADLNEDDFMLNTQQPIYKEQWKNKDKIYNTNPSKLRLVNTLNIIKPYLLRRYLYKNCTPITEVV